MKSNLRVNGWFIGRSKAYVMVIALNVCYGCGTAIAEPSAVKEPALPARHERAELGDSQLQRGERGPKDSIDSHAIARPVAGARVQTAEGAKNSGTVSGASTGATGLPLSPKGKPMGGYVPKQKNPSTNECENYCSFYGLLPLLISCAGMAYSFSGKSTSL